MMGIVCLAPNDHVNDAPASQERSSHQYLQYLDREVLKTGPTPCSIAAQLNSKGTNSISVRVCLTISRLVSGQACVRLAQSASY